MSNVNVSGVMQQGMNDEGNGQFTAGTTELSSCIRRQEGKGKGL